MRKNTRLRKRLIALALVGAAVGGIATAAQTTVPTEGAQAFNSFTYLADCPGTAKYQQLVIVNYTWDGINVTKQRNPPFGVIYYGYYAEPGPHGKVSYIPVENADRVQYGFSGNGSLYWNYHVDCFY